MASCTQIKGAVQAFVDSELSPAERVIVEEHLGNCDSCQRLLRNQQKVSATLFEHYRDRRLGQSLRTSVVCHLPEMDTMSMELEEVNWRVKHPSRRWWALYGRWVPAIAVVLLLIVGAIIHLNWPAQGPSDSAFGVVTHVAGNTTVYEGDSGRSAGARSGGFVLPEHVYSTGTDGAAMFALRYGTVTKVAANSRVHLRSPRQLVLDKGQAWFDVGRNSKLFQVQTPNGRITVFGTAFDVRLEDNATVVTVQHGEVQVENTDGFRRVISGQRIRFTTRGHLGNPENIDADKACAWTAALVPDRDARALYARHFGSDGIGQASIPALPIFWMPLQGRDLPNGGLVEVTWEPGAPARNYCSYTVFVADESGNSILRHRMDGAVFESTQNQPYLIPVGGEALKNIKALNVWLVPDYTSGNVEPRGLSVPSLVPSAAMP